MTIYEYDDLIKTLRNARRRARRAIERGDNVTLGTAQHEEEMAEYALGRLVEGQIPARRSAQEVR